MPLPTHCWTETCEQLALASPTNGLTNALGRADLMAAWPPFAIGAAAVADPGPCSEAGYISVHPPQDRREDAITIADFSVSSASLWQHHRW